MYPRSGSEHELLYFVGIMKVTYSVKRKKFNVGKYTRHTKNFYYLFRGNKALQKRL